MLAVAEINYIRHEIIKKDSNYSEIAQRLGRDSRTVKKYAEQEVITPTFDVEPIFIIQFSI
ncbi:hypothetical protein ACIQZI_03785 [Peribacillus sp. NPDC096379]|uniref:hypothetical protein n=1 Tax=Peribacillus sp. NPDC096379 TaxID=3364393 RepID=UPI0038025FA8